MAQQSLYEQLGGKNAIRAVVDEFYDRVLADDHVAHYFTETNMAAQRAHQTQFLSAVAGGPVEYDGLDMKTAHEGMGITTSEFDAIATHLGEALKACGVDEERRTDVLTAVDGYRDVIVEQAE